MKNKIDKAVILIAGLGTRLGQQTVDLPKALLKVDNESLLHRQILQCIKLEIPEVVLITGHASESVDQWLKNIRLPIQISTVYNPDYATKGNVVSLLCAHKMVQDQSFILLDGDLLLHTDLLFKLLDSPHQSAILVDTKKTLTKEDMKVLLDNNNHISAFGKWLPLSANGTYIGVGKFHSEHTDLIFECLRNATEIEGRTSIFYEDAWHSYVSKGLKIGCVEVADLAWLEIDTPEDLENARKLAPQLDHNMVGN